jgi:hypothetical protein
MSETAHVPAQVEDPTIAVRVWTTRARRGRRAYDDQPSVVPKRRYPTEALIFDTETEPGPEQRVRLLVWRLYRDGPGEEPGNHCIEEGVAYPDDLAERDPDGYELLCEHASRQIADVAPGMGARGVEGGMTVRPLSWWLENRLFRYGYAHRDYCYVVGFNLPFDLGGIAPHWSPGRGAYRGGWSLGVWGSYDETGKWTDRRHRPRLLMKPIDPRRTLFAWGSLKRGDAVGRGQARFIDLRTLAFALTDRSYTLEGACKAFGAPYEKSDVDYGRMSTELIEYAIEDVRHTSVLYRNLLAELSRHPGVDLEPHRLFSPATVGARYLEAMGMERPLEKFTSQADESDRVTDELLGYAMSAFYGGRAEARIVRTPVPVAHVDFTSMYPAVNALIGTWDILRAEHVGIADATSWTRELLDTPRLLARCLTPELWREIGVTLVEIEPDGDILPVRATYNRDSPELGIGVNPLHYEGRLWYALPDVIAATLLGGDKPPKIARAIRLAGEGTQAGLTPVLLRGASELDPAGNHDPFLSMIEQRAEVRDDLARPKEERDRLELFLKITANATAYGSLARLDRKDLAKAVKVTIHGPDAEPKVEWSTTPEDPGPYCFPPVACTITAGARLLLAMLERLVTDSGGTYAFCDTDSMAIVATPAGGPVDCETEHGPTVQALGWGEVQEILDRFASLNPYDPSLSLKPWKVEYDSLDQQLWCYAISAKRYALYRSDGANPELLAVSSDGDVDTDLASDAIELLFGSKHALGMYMDPNPSAESADGDEGRPWIKETWRWIVVKANGGSPRRPGWTRHYALTRFTVSSPALAEWFVGRDAQRPASERVRPGSFGLLAHPGPAFPTQRKPTADYEIDPDKWAELDWYDRGDGQPVTVIPPLARDDTESFADALEAGAVIVDTITDVLGRYLRRPEHKSLSPDGEPATGQTRGQLLRRPIAAHPANTLLTGKEGNEIIERLTLVTLDPTASRNAYGTRTEMWPIVLDALRDAGAQTLLAAGLPHSTVYTVFAGTRPRANRSIYREVAARHAEAALRDWDVDVPASLIGLLAAYGREREARGANIRACKWCGRPLPKDARADARYDSPACRQAARRAGRR